MPLISDPEHVRRIYDRATGSGACLANFCTANHLTTEAIFCAVHSFGQRAGLHGLPVVISATGNYPIEPQLQHYTASGDARLGLRALLADVDLFLSADSPYHDVQVMLHLDHAQPGIDDELIPLAVDTFATIMLDCSVLPLEENMRRVAEFVERNRDRVLVEGAVDEVVQAEGAAGHGRLTDPAVAERYLHNTGVFLIVPNLGTEHRAMDAVARYERELARAIRARVGPRMVLHGSSSLRDDDLAGLADDGIAKVNVWSIFERLGGQAVARDVVHNLGNLLPAAELAAWHEDGTLGPRPLGDAYRRDECRGVIGPKGWALVDRRRREVWQAAVVARMVFYLERLGYGRLAI
jgi:fructose-bisphosphate aldolase class II